MNKNEKIMELADIVVERLKKHGITILRYNAYSTSSVYLKFDYGMVNSLRIGDHTGKKHLNYMFNLLLGYSGKRVHKTEFTRYFYSEHELDELVAHIISAKERKIKTLGAICYRNKMNESLETNSSKRGFWSNSYEV